MIEKMCIHCTNRVLVESYAHQAVCPPCASRGRSEPKEVPWEHKSIEEKIEDLHLRMVAMESMTNGQKSKH